MDVALDANRFLSDVRMEGVAFQSLLSYLRKTDSKLIIPEIIFEEVVARYPSRLTAAHRKAVNEMKAFRSVLISSKAPKVADLKMQQEINILKAKLKKPSKYVSSKILKNYSAIAVEEIARRGIHRIPPANSEGEELRDVISWLMLLNYAKKSGRELALISADKHFGQGDDLHPLLMEEVKKTQVAISFYRTIDMFIKSHAPAPAPLVEDDARRLLSQQVVLDIFEIEARALYSKRWDPSEIEITNRSVSFTRGALYDVGNGAKYGEMEFECKLFLTITRSEYPYYSGNVLAQHTPVVQNLSNTVSSLNYYTASVNQPISAPFTVQNLVQPIIGTAEMYPPLKINGAVVDFQNTTIPTYTPITLDPISIKKSTIISGNLSISVRILAGKTANVELESITLAENSKSTVSALNDRAPSSQI